jgi:hypothetical protein
MGEPMLMFGVAALVIGAIGLLSVLALGQVGVGGLGGLLGGRQRQSGVISVGNGGLPGAVTLTRRTAAITALNTLTTVDLNAEGSSSPIVIPGNVSKIVRVIISLACDYGAAVVSLSTLSQVRLSGQGIGGGLHEFAGPASSIQGVSSGNAIVMFSTSYDVAIPVTAGVTPIVQAAIAGDTAPGGAYLMVTLQFA